MNEAPHPHGRWHKVLDFPLVAMLVALAMFVLATGATTLVMKAAPLPPGNVRMLVGGILVIALLLAGYKLVTRHLGDEPRDDLAVAAGTGDCGKIVYRAIVALIVSFKALAVRKPVSPSSSHSFIPKSAATFINSESKRFPDHCRLA